MASPFRNGTWDETYASGGGVPLGMSLGRLQGVSEPDPLLTLPSLPSAFSETEREPASKLQHASFSTCRCACIKCTQTAACFEKTRCLLPSHLLQAAGVAAAAGCTTAIMSSHFGSATCVRPPRRVKLLSGTSRSMQGRV